MTSPFAARLAFLRDLEGHALRLARGKAVKAPDDRCARLVEQAAEQVQWLARALPLGDRLPAGLRDDALLESIYERAGADAAARMEPLLQEAVRPVDAPADFGNAGLEAPVREALSQPRDLPASASEAIWASLRAELRDHMADKVGQTGSGDVVGPRRRVAASSYLAASLVLGALVASGIFGGGSPGDGTPEPVANVIQFEDREVPVSALFTLPRADRKSE